jgi:hypothetical protein
MAAVMQIGIAGAYHNGLSYNARKGIATSAAKSPAVAATAANVGALNGLRAMP